MDVPESREYPGSRRFLPERSCTIAVQGVLREAKSEYLAAYRVAVDQYGELLRAQGGRAHRKI
jgi:hypothetical protein